MLMKMVALAMLAAFLAAGTARAAENYKVDPVHSAVIFGVRHANIGNVYGRFDDFGGAVTLDDGDASKDSISFEIQAGSVNTRVPKRDEHLRSPDFLNAKQYPKITFKSTSVKKGENNMLEVTGDLTLHGVTRSVTIPVQILGTGQFPPGTPRVGLEANFTVKRAEFDIKGMPGAVGDEIRLIVAVEAAK
jgi:polyisoprenoid-binding protein YceI